jgi:hypothetical protein
MKFNEMKAKYDEFNAFSDFCTVEHAKQIDLIPVAWHDVFPNKCSCGSEMIINLARTKFTCCNPRCRIKQGFALSELFSRFNIKGIADATCSDVYEMLQRKNEERTSQGEKPLFLSDSYVEILNVDEKDYPISFQQSAKGMEFIDGINSMKNCSLTFSEMVSRLGLPEFDSTAKKLFSDINSFEELMTTIKAENGIYNFCSRRGVYAVQKMFWLKVSLQDIAVAWFIFGEQSRMHGLQNLDICITGSVFYNGSKYTKSDFIKICNAHAYSHSMSEILKEIFKDNSMIEYEDFIKICKELKCEINTQKFETINQNELFELIDQSELDFAVQLYEINMTTAKKSVPYIVGDTPSSSSKYLEGLRRGVEIDSDGNSHKVLVTSNELISEIDNKVKIWEGGLIKRCKNLIQSSKMTIF